MKMKLFAVALFAALVLGGCAGMPNKAARDPSEHGQDVRKRMHRHFLTIISEKYEIYS